MDLCKIFMSATALLLFFLASFIVMPLIALLCLGFLICAVLALPFLFALWLFKDNRKCKFAKRCQWYDSDSATCNETGGDYYGPGRPAGCYRQMEEGIKGRDKKYALYFKGKRVEGVTFHYSLDKKDIIDGLKKGYSIKEI